MRVFGTYGYGLGLGFGLLGLGFKVRVRACPITIVNLIFANLEMEAK